jgi:hypothetical protein
MGCSDCSMLGERRGIETLLKETREHSVKLTPALPFRSSSFMDSTPADLNVVIVDLFTPENTCMFKTGCGGLVRWHTPVIPATARAEARGSHLA